MAKLIEKLCLVFQPVKLRLLRLLPLIRLYFFMAEELRLQPVGYLLILALN